MMDNGTESTVFSVSERRCYLGVSVIRTIIRGNVPEKQKVEAWKCGRERRERGEEVVA